MRGNQVVLSADAAFSLGGDDQLLVLGTDEQIEALDQALAGTRRPQLTDGRDAGGCLPGGVPGAREPRPRPASVLPKTVPEIVAVHAPDTVRRPAVAQCWSRSPGRSAMHTHEIISTHPNVGGVVNAALVACIEACFDCAQTCTTCADACLSEPDVIELRQCIRLCLDCAGICVATGSVVSRRPEGDDPILTRVVETCAEVCRLCAEECARHAKHHVHCRVSAEVCRQCEQACGTFAGAITPVPS